MLTRRTFFALLAASVSAAAAPSAFAAKVYTPPKGSTERKAIMNALRAKGDDQDRIFVVRYLKVSQGWAWATVDPQSSDGQNHYETESALLRKTGKTWKVIDQPCSEADCDGDEEIARIQDENPDAPEEIFP